MWDRPEETAFCSLKELLYQKSILQFDEPCTVTTDTLDVALGCILSQGQIGQDRPIAYDSRALVGAELNYSTTEKDLLAFGYAVGQFRPYS